MTTLFSGAVAIVVGGVIGAASIVGVVTSQMSSPTHSPAQSNNIVVPYGNN